MTVLLSIINLVFEEPFNDQYGKGGGHVEVQQLLIAAPLVAIFPATVLFKDRTFDGHICECDGSNCKG